MAFVIEDKSGRRTTRRTVNRRKLLVEQKVEVRSTEEGFRGSWHGGTVISCEKAARLVQYDHLLLDEDSSTKLVERVEVSSIVDGIASKDSLLSNYRGWIRPLPPPCDFNIWFLHYGQCVDVYYLDAWWEGVIIDHQDGFSERKVFFPDMGDEMTVHKDKLRISQDWDEQTEVWKPRGNWLFLELIEEIEKDWPILVSVKQIWYDVRAKNGFDNLKEWTSCRSDIWRGLLSEVIVDNFKFLVKDFFWNLSSSGNILQECDQFMGLNGPVLDALMKNKTCFGDSLAVDLLNSYELLPVDKRERFCQPSDEINRDELDTIKESDRLEKVPFSSSINPTDEETPCVSPPTMTIVPSITNEMSKGNSCTNHEESCNTSLKLSMQHKQSVWFPAGPNIVPKAEYCADAVEEYCKLFKSGDERNEEVRLNARGHLLFMGWKIEYKIDKMQPRIRYTEPGGKCFASLVKACEYLRRTGSVSRDFSSCTGLKIPKEKIQDNWVAVSLPEAEFREDAIIEYINVCKCRRRPSEDHTKNVLKHLTFLGWKVENIQNKWMFRYSPPDGSGECFRSLFEVCHHLGKSSSAVVSHFPQNEQNCYVADATVYPSTEKSQECKKELVGPLPNDDRICEPEYCPQAVLNYYSHGIKEKGDPRKCKRDCKLEDMQLKAKRHLSAVGWKLYHFQKKSKRSTSELMYSSPSGTLYNSLRLACKGYLDEEINVGKLAEVLLSGEGRCSPLTRKEVNRKHEKKRKSSALRLASRTSNSLKKEKRSKEIQAINSRDNLNSDVSDCVLRSSKRAREVKPRPILSWLIDNNVVLPRAKVQDRSRRDDQTMAKGRVTRDAIRCSCCQETFNLRNFEAHANSTCHQPSANIFLEEGRSPLECRMQLRDINARGSSRGLREVKSKQSDKKNDSICSICHSEGNLILCDRCPSSFHTRCLGLKGFPDGDWFCPSCCCKICGRSEINGDIEVFADSSVINCDQCEHKYHIGCLRRKGLVLEKDSKGYWFCNKKCEQILLGLQKLLGKPVQVGIDNLTWTLLKYTKPDKCDHDPSNIEHSTENYSKLNVALGVMHECFRPFQEPWTRRDLVEDVIFNRQSELNRLNFRGFYTVLLEKNDELITVATVRVYGEKVAEIPLVATRFLYQRRGMCRILINELEKVLVELGVEMLVLPAVSSVLNTWISSFGFSRMSTSERLKFLDYTFLNFQGTTMCQKLLLMPPCIKSITPRMAKQHSGDTSGNCNMDIEKSRGVPDILQADRIEDSGTVGQTSMKNG